MTSAREPRDTVSRRRASSVALKRTARAFSSAGSARRRRAHRNTCVSTADKTATAHRRSRAARALEPVSRESMVAATGSTAGATVGSPTAPRPTRAPGTPARAPTRRLTVSLRAHSAIPTRTVVRRRAHQKEAVPVSRSISRAERIPPVVRPRARMEHARLCVRQRVGFALTRSISAARGAAKVTAASWQAACGRTMDASATLRAAAATATVRS